MNFADQLNVRPWELGELTMVQFYQSIAEFERQAKEAAAKK
jgi:hypothetical protein